MNKTLIGSAVVGAILSVASVVHAEDAEYCAKVRARAASDAIWMYSPSVQIQGIHFPEAAPNVLAVGGSTTSDGDQFRGGLMWNALNAYKGTQVVSLADKDCLQHSAITQVKNLLEQSSDVGKLGALQAQDDYLTSQQGNIQQTLTDAHQRVASGYATNIELLPLQQIADRLTIRQAQAKGQMEVIQAKGYVNSPATIPTLIAALQQATKEYEAQSSRVRMLQPWGFDMTGGVIPPMAIGDKVSWFGMAEITYNFGGLFMGKQETRYQQARAQELNTAHYELVSQLYRFQQTVHANISAIEQEMVALESHIAAITQSMQELKQHPDAPHVPVALDLLGLQLIEANTDRAMMQGMLDALHQVY